MVNAALCGAVMLLLGFTDAFSNAPARRRPKKSATSSAIGVTQVESSYETFGDAALSKEPFSELYSISGDDSSGEKLPLWLTERCTECGWPTPTLVQRRSLDAILSGNDVVIQAQTGSGKTLSFLLPLLSKIDASRSAVQAVIVVPTRELGLQVSRVARRLAAASGPDTEARGKIMVMPILQGSKNRRQRAWAWAEPPHVVVGTPDELTKMVSKGGIRYNSVKFVVVDEVDACLLSNGGAVSMSNLASAGPLHELLSRYLSPTYDEVDVLDGHSASLVSTSAADLAGSSKTVSHGTDRQTVFCSATIPQHNHFMRQCVQNQWTVREPTHVCASPGELVPPTLSHSYVVCDGNENKPIGLRRILKKEIGRGRLRKALVFCEPQRPLEQMAAAIAADLNGTVWTGLRNDEAGKTKAVVSVLRYEDSLSARAAAMNAFRGPGSMPRRVGSVKFGSDWGQESGFLDDGVEKESDDAVRIMISTDLAARGLDVMDVTHVINYDLPNDGDTYVHRGGRAGRLGRKGTVLSLITGEQEFVLERLANKLGLTVRCVARQESKRRRSRGRQ